MKYLISRLTLHLVILCLLVLAALFGLNSWLSSYTHHGESVQVPNVIGIDAIQATSVLVDAGLNVTYVDTVFSESVDPGAVVEQVPEGGLPVKMERIVYLTVCSREKQQMKMPDLSGVISGSLRNTRSTLEQAGFIPDSVEYVLNDFEDEVLAVKTLDGRDVVGGAMYDKYTHLIVVVGCTTLEPEVTEEPIDTLWIGN